MPGTILERNLLTNVVAAVSPAPIPRTVKAPRKSNIDKISEWIYAKHDIAFRKIPTAVAMLAAVYFNYYGGKLRVYRTRCLGGN